VSLAVASFSVRRETSLPPGRLRKPAKNNSLFIVSSRPDYEKGSGFNLAPFYFFSIAG
jgi:hypothetical protein